MIRPYIEVFIISMLPFVELRGAMIYSQAIGLNIFASSIMSIIGNVIVMPLIFYFSLAILKLGSKSRIEIISKPCNYFIEKGKSAGEKLLERSAKRVYTTLYLFIAIPFPGTGVWTGILGASILELDFKKSFIATIFGTITSCVIMAIFSYIGFRII